MSTALAWEETNRWGDRCSAGLRRREDLTAYPVKLRREIRSSWRPDLPRLGASTLGNGHAGGQPRPS